MNKKDRPIITYTIEEGSVRHIFKTGVQAIIGFSAILMQISKEGSIDFLELKTALAIENIQHLAQQKNYEFELKSSTNNDTLLIINSTTNYTRTENLWVDAELYFYGSLTNAGGKGKANIHIDTDDFGTIIIETDREFLKDREENVLYKDFGVRALGKQNIQTGEIDRSSLKLIGLIDFTPKYDDVYLKGLISRAKRNWKGINPDEWLDQFRGGYDA